MQKNQDSRLGTENITKLMISLAIPAVLAQIVNVLYNIVDRIYIGRIPGVGAAALTGVGVTFPIITSSLPFPALPAEEAHRWHPLPWDRATGNGQKGSLEMPHHCFCSFLHF